MKRLMTTAIAIALLTPALFAATLTTAQAQMPRIITPNHRLVEDIVAAENTKRAERQRQAQAQAEAAERERQAREKQAQAEAAQRERQRQENEAQRPAREQAAREAQERARIAALPSTRLGAGYAAFAYVSWCQEVRDGYAYKYINDAELERAKIAVKAIVEQTTKEDPAINTDEVWQDALNMIAPRITPRHATRNGQVEVCQDALRQLFQMSPASVYPIAKP